MQQPQRACLEQAARLSVALRCSLWLAVGCWSSEQCAGLLRASFACATGRAQHVCTLQLISCNKTALMFFYTHSPKPTACGAQACGRARSAASPSVIRHMLCAGEDNGLLFVQRSWFVRSRLHLSCLSDTGICLGESYLIETSVYLWIRCSLPTPGSPRLHSQAQSAQPQAAAAQQAYGAAVQPSATATAAYPRAGQQQQLGGQQAYQYGTGAGQGSSQYSSTAGGGYSSTAAGAGYGMQQAAGMQAAGQQSATMQPAGQYGGQGAAAQRTAVRPASSQAFFDINLWPWLFNLFKRKQLS